MAFKRPPPKKPPKGSPKKPPKGPPKKSDPKIVEAAEIARMGVRAYTTKKKVTPQRWRRIVKEAHARGFTVDSFLDANTPAALKSRTKEGIRKEATTTISQAYKPAETELTQQETRAKSISDKRARDNRYYNDWLAQKSAELATHARASDQLMIETQRGMQQEVANQYGQLRQQLIEGAQQSPGNISNPQQATAFDVSEEAKRDLAMVANAREQSRSMVESSQKRQQTESAANFAQIAASESRRQADLWNRLKDVADERTKLTLQKGADTAKEIARLLDVEIDKANANREFGVVSERLGVDQAKLEQDQREFNTETKLKSRDLTRKEREAAQRKRDAAADRKLARDKLRQTAADKAADRQARIDLETYKASLKNKTGDGGRKLTSGERNRSAAVFTRISSVAGEINRLKRKGTKRSIRDVLASKGVSAIEYELALDIGTGDKKLSPYNQKRAKAMGLIIPDHWK